jgi:hypothetical protein
MFHSSYPLLVIPETVDIFGTLVGSVLYKQKLCKSKANNCEE